MKILITGARGMVGTALAANLKNIKENKNRTRPGLSIEEIYEYDMDSTPEELDDYCSRADFVFHLAGVNRPKDPADFMKGNFGFAGVLLDTLKRHQSRAGIMLASSIQATLADEISSWVVFRKFQTSGVTSRMEVRYLKPIHTTDDYITLHATVARIRRNVIDIEVKIYDSKDELCTEALCIYFIFPKDKAREEFHFCDCGVEEDV